MLPLGEKWNSKTWYFPHLYFVKIHKNHHSPSVIKTKWNNIVHLASKTTRECIDLCSFILSRLVHSFNEKCPPLHNLSWATLVWIPFKQTLNILKSQTFWTQFRLLSHCVWRRYSPRKLFSLFSKECGLHFNRCLEVVENIYQMSF